MSSRRRARPGSAPVRSSGGGGSGSGRGSGGARQPRAARPASASSSGGSRGYAAPTLASMHKENDVPNVVGSCDMVRGPGARGRLPLRPRPRPGRLGSQTIPLKPGERHPLGGWVGQSEHASSQELWHSRWKGLQPDVSFDVDGDGVVSSEDLLVAREFDKDGNGVLDGEERRELRRALAKTGIETYYALPKGPPLRKAPTKSSLLFPTPREAAPTDGIDPDSDAWHFRMDTLHQKTRTLQKYSSERMRGLIAHAHTDAKPVNMIRDLMDAKQGMKAQGNARISSNARTPRSARSPRARQQDKMREIFDSIDEDNSGYLDRQELGHLAKRAGRHLNERQLDDAMRAMDADGSGQVDFDEFCDWWEHGKIEPPQGSEVFTRITDQVERKVSNVRTLFRKFDENCDGTVSHKEFRQGLSVQLGIDISDEEFATLMKTIDEDNSNEIDYNEFAKSGMLGSKLFAARTMSSGCGTRKELLEKRKQDYRRFGQQKMDTFWERAKVEPKLSLPATII